MSTLKSVVILSIVDPRHALTVRSEVMVKVKVRVRVGWVRAGMDLHVDTTAHF